MAVLLGATVVAAACGSILDRDIAGSDADAPPAVTMVEPIPDPRTASTVPASSEDDGRNADALAQHDAVDLGASVPLDSWASAGIEPEVGRGEPIDLAELGARPDDGVADTEAMVAALRQAGERPGLTVVTIPDGDVELDETVTVPGGVILRGAGPASRLVVDLGGRDGAGLLATGVASPTWSDLPVPPSRNGVEIVVDDPGRFAPGDHIEIEQDNDEAMYTRPEWRVDWGAGSVGELNRIEAIDGDRLRLRSPLNADYSAELRPRMRTIDPVEAIGIEDLALFRRDDGYGSTIRFEFAAGIWVRNVTSERTSRAHVELDRVWRCRIDGSTFHDASDFGDGGRGYGISLARHTTGCLVVDNALYDLRHAIIIQLGASGNVVAYNDARGSAGYDDRQPRADLSLHGHWPQGNLFEGNVVDRVVSSDWWGPSGPSNTFHRNCILDHLILTDHSDHQAVVANIIAAGGLRIDEDIVGTVLADNRVGGAPVADQAERTEPVASLWRSQRPDFLDDHPWPVIGPETDGACRLPASDRSAATRP